MSDDAVVIERTFDAPIELVWQAWTEGEHFAQWYGPEGFTIPVAEMDATVGGRRHICMASPDGSMKMWFVGEYKVVEPTGKLVYTEAMSDEDGNLLSPSAMGMPGDEPMITEVTVELSADGDGTAVVMTHAGIPADSPGAQGWAMAFDKLAVKLAA